MSTDLSSKHPNYMSAVEDWTLMRDAYKGQRQVKSKRQTYLPPTSGQVADGMTSPEQPGSKAYAAYLMRARFPNFVREAVQTAVGMLHSQPAKITLPKEMENIRSSRGEDLHQLLVRINTEQLVTGRLGVLADLPTSGGDMPYLATYATERLINWDDGTKEGLVPQVLNFVVLDESEYERANTSFTWEVEEKYRVLILGSIDVNVSKAPYSFGVFNSKDVDFKPESLKQPSLKGEMLQKIPFVIINSCDLTTEPDEPPLLDLGELCMTVYRGEADYRQNLFMQGQDTLVVIGGGQEEDETLRTGAGARIDISNPQGDAKFIGVTSDGLSEQREALKEDRSRAGSMGAQSLDSTSRERESGKSLGIRIAARTADLNQIADAGAKGLESILKICAEWMRLDPNEVSVEPNREFGDHELTGQTMVEQQTARNLGFPISARTLHQQAVDRGLTSMTFEEEMAAAKAEESTIFKRAESGDRNGDQKDKTGKPSDVDETNA